MTVAQKVHEAALHMRDLAREAELPGYAEKLIKAADDLEKRAVELDLRGPDVTLMAPREIH